ncbi:hypothetical protein BGX38DRAFT_1172296 [Terfezia claveryi]|nr:hypothetical protein BGX38DRAFT_1172296 [Terfezia claveryi]
MEGKVGEIIGMGYEYWYKTPKWAFLMVLALLLKWITYVSPGSLFRDDMLCERIAN